MSFFETTKVPTTHVFQNHLDHLHELLDEYCRSHGDFRWGISAQKKSIIGLTQVEHYVMKVEPRVVHYFLASGSRSGRIDILIENGITVNLKNGDYDLLGFFYSLNRVIGSLKIPAFLVFVRRWWLPNIFIAIWFIPAIILILFSQGFWALTWAITAPIIEFVFLATILNDLEIEPEWSDVILSTKISYGVYNHRLGSSFFVFLTSTRSIVSFLAALATIISTLVLFLRH